jgi:DNA-binding transcriptional regulator GbsR (MarR family)
MSVAPTITPVVRRFIEEAGITTQSFGLGRVVGQIYAYLYFSETPRGLADLQEALGISKGSASMGVRQLEQWEAVRKVWVKGDRKDYYEANAWFGRILKRVLFDTIAQKMSSYTSLLQEAHAELNDQNDDPDAPDHGPNDHGPNDFLRDRLAHLQKFHDKAKGAWDNPLLQRLLK